MSLYEITSKTVKAMELAWDAIRQEHPDLPAAVMVLASGVEGKRLSKWGHWAASRWSVNGSRVAEVLVAGELLAPMGPAAGMGQDLGERILGTLLHEAGHGLAYARGVKDTSRAGRYHNQRYAELAKELGLEVAKHATQGWAITALSDAMRQRYASQIEELRAAANGYRWAPQKTGKGTIGKSQKRPLFVCRCNPPRKLRMSPSVFEVAPIICGACEQRFSADI